MKQTNAVGRQPRRTRKDNHVTFLNLYIDYFVMSPYCSAHDEWLIMKLYVGYHDANNVSNVDGDPVTQLNLKKNYSIILSVRRHVAIIARHMMNG